MVCLSIKGVNYIMTNYKQLSKEDRNTIENLINKGFNFSSIANSIKYDRTTISKEIKRNRYLKNHLYSTYSQTGIKKAIAMCDKLSKPPYCCNNCKFKNSCMNYHLYYNASIAQKHYEDTRKESRAGINLTNDEITIINKNIVPLVKNKKQSVNQIFINHPDILYFSKTTFYKYINEGIISLTNLDLPRKVKYKKRKKNKNKENKKDISIMINRTYEDYIIRINNDSKLNVWQLDTVIGLNDDSKCLMTFLHVETNFMVIRLLDKKNVLNVDKAFTEIKNDLGINLYKKAIDIILTDNGSEFFDPCHLEYDLDTGEKLCSLYYCHPNSPEEKPELEKNHEYIRYVLPKGTSFENLTPEDIKRLENNINNIPRDILGGKTPYQLIKEKFPTLLEKLNSDFIEPDEVSLNPKDIIG